MKSVVCGCSFTYVPLGSDAFFTCRHDEGCHGQSLGHTPSAVSCLCSLHHLRHASMSMCCCSAAAALLGDKPADGAEGSLRSTINAFWCSMAALKGKRN